MATRWTMIIEEHRLRAALALVVASTRPDRIDVTNVAFRLRVNLGVAINLAGGGLQHTARASAARARARCKRRARRSAAFRSDPVGSGEAKPDTPDCHYDR